MPDTIPRGSLVLLTPDGPFLRSPDAAEAPSSGLDSGIYDALCGLGLRGEMLTALAFVIEEDEEVVQACRDLVRAEDIAELANAYWYLSTWNQRTCFVHLVCDYRHKALAPIWRDILRAPIVARDDDRHAAKVVAIWRLTGSHGNMAAFDDEDIVRVASGALGHDLVVPLPSLRKTG